MFKKGQALYVINDANEKNYEIINSILSSLKISISEIKNPSLSLENFPNEELVAEYINNLPNNTVFGKNIFEEGNFFISIPFISSHISIPIKPGEYFWYFEDEEDDLDGTLENSIRIKNFWVSRIHGTNISEDSNFSFYQRDFQKYDYIDKEIEKIQDTSREKQISNLEKEILKNSIKEVKFDDNKDFKDLTNDIDSNSIISSSNKNFKAYSRYFSDFRDLTFQGSNNTLINLGRNILSKSSKSAAIDIVAGRNYIDSFNYNSLIDSELLSDVYDDSFNLLGNVKLSLKNEDKIDSVIKIENMNGYEEVLKDPSFYFVNNEKFNSINNEDIQESKLNINLDASRIYISELELVDSLKFYDINFIPNQVSEENIQISEELPTILLKSNNIRIISRKESSSNDNINLSEGSIRLVKESNKYDNYSHIMMEKNGDIYLDGKNIYIGSSKKNPNQEEESHIVTLCESENSEPLVLGKTLETKLTEILDELITAMTTINIATLPLGADITSSIVNLELKKSSLKEFLSIYSKTS